MSAFVADFKPVSGLTFRDARPFQAGESASARNLAFPPPPTAFWHAARAALRQQGLKSRVTVRSFGLVALFGTAACLFTSLTLVPAMMARRRKS